MSNSEKRSGSRRAIEPVDSDDATQIADMSFQEGAAAPSAQELLDVALARYAALMEVPSHVTIAARGGPRTYNSFVFDWRTIGKEEKDAFLDAHFAAGGKLDAYALSTGDGWKWMNRHAIPFALLSAAPFEETLAERFAPANVDGILFLDLSKWDGKTCPVLHYKVGDAAGPKPLVPSLEQLKLEVGPDFDDAA